MKKLKEIIEKEESRINKNTLTHKSGMFKERKDVKKKERKKWRKDGRKGEREINK